jgi:hypothetical protein
LFFKWGVIQGLVIDAVVKVILFAMRDGMHLLSGSEFLSKGDRPHTACLNI